MNAFSCRLSAQRHQVVLDLKCGWIYDSLAPLSSLEQHIGEKKSDRKEVQPSRTISLSRLSQPKPDASRFTINDLASSSWRVPPESNCQRNSFLDDYSVLMLCHVSFIFPLVSSLDHSFPIIHAGSSESWGTPCSINYAHYVALQRLSQRWGYRNS